MMGLLYQKEIPLRKHVDVLVAGGGPAGIAAAVTAANHGSSVLLVEAFGAFGGAAAHALVPAFMQFTDGVNFLAGGFGRRVYDQLLERSPAECLEFVPDSIPIETLKLCYDDLVMKSGAQFLFFTQIVDVIVENSKATHVICANKNGCFAVQAKMFIDCTGDGDLCAFANAPFEKGDENGSMMAATLCALWAGMEYEQVVQPDSRRLEDAFRDHVFSTEDRHLPGMWTISRQVCGSNAGHIYDVDGSDVESLTKAMLCGRKQLQEYKAYYRNYLTGFENLELVVSATQIGIRETRRITGDYTLSMNDYINRAGFSDEIGRYAYPVDIHASSDSTEDYQNYKEHFVNSRYKAGESYGIPYRSLLVKGMDNIITAGRCISADRPMQSSVRVMPCCFITGQAAGAAAHLAASQSIGLRSIEINELQRLLEGLGAFLKRTD